MTIDNAALRQFILQSFSDEELDTLCFDYFPEVVAEFGHGEIKTGEVRQVTIHYPEQRLSIPWYTSIMMM